MFFLSVELVLKSLDSDGELSQLGIVLALFVQFCLELLCFLVGGAISVYSFSGVLGGVQFLLQRLDAFLQLFNTDFGLNLSFIIESLGFTKSCKIFFALVTCWILKVTDALCNFQTLLNEIPLLFFRL